MIIYLSRVYPKNDYSEPVRILIMEKTHALFSKRTLPILSDFSTLLVPPALLASLLYSNTHVMCHFRTFALVLPFSCKYLSPGKFRLNSLILVLLWRHLSVMSKLSTLLKIESPSKGQCSQSILTIINIALFSIGFLTFWHTT